MRGEAIGIPVAVPPLVMPSHEKLDAASESPFRSLLLPDHGVSMQVEPFDVGQRAVLFDVVPVHRKLTDIVDQGRLLEYEAVV